MTSTAVDSGAPASTTDPPAAPNPPAPGDAEPTRTPRRYLWIVSGLIFLQVLLQRWGLVTHDTRLDLLLSPGAFLTKVWTFWDPVTDMGHIRNQTIGYLFPMGPTMLAGRVLGLAPWVVERIWITFLLVAAFWGVVRLLDQLVVGSVPARLIAASGYALSPFFLARVGNTSSFVLGAAFLPWALLPLVRGSRSGSPRRAAALSGLAVLFMGGINAAVTVSVLAMPVVWLLTRQRGPRRRLLTSWWLVALGLATFWWVAALLLQGRYGVDFLHFTETARVTTFFNSPFELVRGLSDWLSYFHIDQTLTVGGDIEASNPMVIAATGLVAAAGLFGLCRRDLPERKFLVITFLVGVAIIGAGYGGGLGNPLDGVVRWALDGPLGALRTVYKFAPIVLLCLIIGFAHAITVIGATAARHRPRGRTIVAVVAALLVLLGAWPLLRGDILNDRPISSVPSWWADASEYVAQRPGRTLLVPGLAHGDFYWGYTAEEPFEWNDSGQWAARNLTFQASEGAVVFMDTVQAALARGGDPNLPTYLSDAGFSTVVVRNDGNWTGDDAPPPQALNAALLASGMDHPTSFGPEMQFSDEPGADNRPLHPVEIYTVPGTEDIQPTEAVAASDAVVVSGDPSAPLQLADAGLPDRPSILAQQLTPDVPVPDTWIVTDGNQRRFTYYGRIIDNQTNTLTERDSGPGGVAVESGLPLESKVADQTVGVLDGVDTVTASSYGAIFKPVPEVAPTKALDGDPRTSWVTAAFRNMEGQWIKVDLDGEHSFDTIGVRLLDDGPWRPRVTALDVTTEQGTVRSETAPGEDLQSIAVPPGPTSWVRISLAAVETTDETVAGAGIREIDLPGISIDQRLAVPRQLNETFSDPATNLPAYVFQRVTTNPRALLRRDEEPDMHRRFDLPRDGTLGMSATVSPVASPELLDLVNRTSTFAIQASSTLGDLPGFGARNLLDDSDASIWIAEGSPVGQAPTSTVEGTTSGQDNGSIAGTNPSPAADDAPSLHLSWNQPRVISGLKLTAVPGYSSPASVRITTPEGHIDAPVEADGTVQKFWPVVTSELTLTFPQVSRYAVTTGLGEPKDRPLALSSIQVQGVEDLVGDEIVRSTPVIIPCSEGPAATVDGVTHRFSVTTTLGQLLDFRDVPATPCDGALTLPAGRHDLDTAQGSSPLSIRTVKLASAGTAAALAAPTTDRKTSVIDWGDTRRQVEIAPGQPSYLVVHESTNPGWKATLAGQPLTPVTIDGWQQGYLVPEGDGGTITLTYSPSTTYRASILLGGAFVVLLLGLALLRSRKTEPAPLAPGRVAPVLLWLVAGGTMFAVGGPIGLLVLAGVWAIRFRWRGAPALIAGGAFAAAAVFVAVTQGPYPEDVAGAFGVPATLISIVAIAAVAGTILPIPARFRRSEDTDDLVQPAQPHGAPPPAPQQ